jgi:hypothetical protein
MEAAVPSNVTSYQVTITVSDETLAALTSGGFSLCALKATATTAGGGQPLFWLVSKQFATSMDVQWTSECAVATISYQQSIMIVTSAEIDYGQVLSLPDGTISGGGLPDALSMLNSSSSQYTSGLCSASGGVYSPAAAIPLYGYMMNAFAPIEKALLMFTTYPAQQGEPILRAYAQGLFVDLTSATSRSVSFDINNGWTWEDGGGAAWAQTVPPNALLTPLLIQMTAL